MRKYLTFVVGSLLGVLGCSQNTEREYYGHYRRDVSSFTLDAPRITKMIVRDVAVPRIGKDKVRSYEGKSKDPRNFDYVIVGSWLIERDGDYTEREKKVIKFAERESDEICDLIDKSVGR